MNRPIFIIGDTHGQWDSLFRHLDEKKIKDCFLIHVGDIGVGFKSSDKQKKEIDLINNRFEKRNVLFKGIRGNHDDPSCFQGQVCLSNFELLPDYTYRELNGEKFLFVGGAVSIDRIVRIPNQSWWEEEEFVLKPELIQKTDVLITHSAPSWNGPYDKGGIFNWCQKDSTLWKECVNERQSHDKLIELSQPRKHYAGHFHLSSFSSMNDCDSRILNILEIYEHRKTT